MMLFGSGVAVGLIIVLALLAYCRATNDAE